MNQDINEFTKAIEANLFRLQKIYAAVLQANKLFANAHDLNELFAGICKIAVELGGMKMAWIGVADDSGQRIISTACYGQGTGYLDGIFIATLPDIPEGQGPTGITFRENRTVINQDFQQSPSTKPWWQRAEPYGWGASATFSIQRANQVYAVLNVYSTEKNFFDEDAINLLNGMAVDMGHAIDALDLKRKQQQTEQQLKRSEHIYRTLFETVKQGIVCQDSTGKITNANPAAEKILGLSLAQMQHRTSLDPQWRTIHQDGSDFLAETHPAMLALKTGKTVQNVIMSVFNPKLQTVIWISINAIPIFKEDGQLDYVYTAFDDITAQLQWQSALKESEQRFRNFANAAPVLIWVADSDKNCSWFNQTWLDYTGRTMEQEFGAGWSEGLYSDDLARCLEMYNSYFDKRLPFSMEYRLRGKDGIYRWFIDMGKPRYDDHGVFCGYIGMLTDIDERKKLEENLRFRQFSLDHAGEEVFWIDKNARILDANQSVCNSLGYSLEEIKQLTVFDVDAIFPRERWQEHWQDLKQNKTLRFESVHKNSAGVTFPTEIVANFFEYDGVEYNCALVRNISERKALEQTLREKTDYLNTILNSEPECVKVVDRNGELIEMNRAGLNLLGFDSVEEVRQYGLINFVLPKFRPSFQQLYYDVFQGNNRTLEFILENKEGKQYWLDTHAAPLFDENGTVKALVSVTRDITDRVQLLQKLEYQARIDCLTGLANRRYFFQLAEQELIRTQRYQHQLSVLMIDIDLFKVINDNYGHEIGDLVLQKFAQVCTSILRENDVIGRLGGEEFAVLLPETSEIGAMDVAERIRNALENAEVPLDSTTLLHFTVSIGVTTLTNTDTTISKILKAADTALYQAKNTGRNRIAKQLPIK